MDRMVSMASASAVRRRCVSGDEVDAHSRRSRRVLHWRRGELRAIKRRTNKRERREGRTETWKAAP